MCLASYVIIERIVSHVSEEELLTRLTNSSRHVTLGYVK